MAVRDPLSLPDDGRPSTHEGTVTFIGTATALIRFGAFTILTDPNFLHRGERARLGMGLRSKRLTNPAMGIADLPPIDFVVLSHHHGDHFDDRAAAELDRELPIVTTHHGAGKLARQGFRAASSLETWQARIIERGPWSVRVTAMPGKHAPSAMTRLVPPTMGSMLEFERDGRELLRIYITGDTLLHDDLREIPLRYPEIDLALVHLGGTRILGMLLTMDAEQGVAALRVVAPRTAIPIHYNDYTVFRSPLSDFKALAGSRVGATNVRYLHHGEEYALRSRAASARDA